MLDKRNNNEIYAALKINAVQLFTLKMDGAATGVGFSRDEDT